MHLMCISYEGRRVKEEMTVGEKKGMFKNILFLMLKHASIFIKQTYLLHLLLKQRI